MRGAGSDQPHLQLLWAVLRIDRPLELDLGDLIRCQVVSREFARLAFAHVTHLDQPATAALHGSWWQPARLVSVQAAALQRTAMPAATELPQLRSLQLALDASHEPLDLQPLSALQRLQELQVAGGQTANAAHLPVLRSLVIDPDWAGLRSVLRQSLLTSLTLHVDGGSCYNPSGAACQGVVSLPQLQSLTLFSMHLSGMGGAQALAPCTSLTHLALGFGGGCDCCDPSEDLDTCGLGPLTQLREVCLRYMGHEVELDALQLGSLPALQRLVLLAPQPFRGDGLVPAMLPAMPTPELEVQLDGLSWDAIVSLLGDLVAVQRAARKQSRACFAQLHLSGWPASPAPDDADDEIRAFLVRMLYYGVGVLCDGFVDCDDLWPSDGPDCSDSDGESGMDPMFM